MNHKKSLFRCKVIFLLAISLVLGGCGLFESSEEEVEEEEEEVYCNDIRMSGEDDRDICDDDSECIAERGLIFDAESLNSEGECVNEEGARFYCRFKVASDGGGDADQPPPRYLGREVEGEKWEFIIFDRSNTIPEGFMNFGDSPDCRDSVDDEDSIAVCEACHEIFQEIQEEFYGD